MSTFACLLCGRVFTDPHRKQEIEEVRKKLDGNMVRACDECYAMLEKDPMWRPKKVVQEWA